MCDCGKDRAAVHRHSAPSWRRQVHFTEEQLTAMRGGPTVEQYRRKTIRVGKHASFSTTSGIQGGDAMISCHQLGWLCYSAPPFHGSSRSPWF